VLLRNCSTRPVINGSSAVAGAGFASRLLTSDMRLLRINEQSLDVSCTLSTVSESDCHNETNFMYCLINVPK